MSAVGKNLSFTTSAMKYTLSNGCNNAKPLLCLVALVVRWPRVAIEHNVAVFA